MNAATTGEAVTRRPIPQDMARILGDCRDLAIHRLMLSFTSMLDRVGDLLIARAEKSAIREEQTLFRDARAVLTAERGNLMAEFERDLRQLVDRRMTSGEDAKADFSAVDARKLTLVDTVAMDESVLSSNIVRVVENLCQDELLELNRAVGYLLGRPGLETDANPLAPTTIIEAFTEALRTIHADSRIKFAILKELNQSSLGDINAIYADLNRHLQNLNVVPKLRPSVITRRPGAERAGKGALAEGRPAAAPAQDVDLMAVLQRLAASGISHGGVQVPPAGPERGPSGIPTGGQASATAGGFPQLQSMPAVGPFGGPRILVTQELGDALARLQHGEIGFDVAGIPVQFAGIPQGTHNVLRDLQESPIGARANQLEAMTIELVAMLFDFIFETRDLPDSMKALIGRLQIPVLKAAMLDGAFFSKKSHAAAGQRPCPCWYRLVADHGSR